MTRQVDELRGHFVVCGYGRVGSTVAHELVHDGESFVVIDVNPESLGRARDDGYLVVEGDATDDATLRAGGITRAKGLVATIDSDAQNVYVILSARALNPGLFVVGRASTPSAEEKLARAGADRVVSPYTMAGRRLASSPFGRALWTSSTPRSPMASSPSASRSCMLGRGGGWTG